MPTMITSIGTSPTLNRRNSTRAKIPQSRPRRPVVATIRSESWKSLPNDLRFMLPMVLTLGRVTPRAQGNSHRALMRRGGAPRRLRVPGRGDPDAGDRGRHAAEAEPRADHAGLQAEGQRDAREGDLHERRLRQLPHPCRGEVDGDRRPEPRPGAPGLPARDRARHGRQGRHAVVQGHALRPGDRGRRDLRRQVDVAGRGQDRPIELPPEFPERVAAFASDLDRTLIAEDAVLRPRTRSAIERTRAEGVHVIVVTGRMFRAVRPYLQEAGLDDPVICYQGAVVADPLTGEFLRHVPIPRQTALEAIDAVVEAGFHINCYDDPLLYVAEETPEARAYADFQNLEIYAVGPLHEWLHDDPTKLVAVGDPAELDALEAELKPRFAGRLFVSKSLPYFLEFAHPAVSKGSGLAFVADLLGFTSEATVACGDGENDRELLDWAGYGVAVANAHREILDRADLVVPDVEHEGVAELLEAYLDSRT